MRGRKPLGRRIAANFRKKWVQVCLVVLAYTFVMLLSHRFLVPRPKDIKPEEAGYKFMHCSECKFEIPYQEGKQDTVAQGCKCDPLKNPNAKGYWEPTKKSVKEGTEDDSMGAFYTAVLIESVLFMAALYYTLAWKDPTPDFYFVRCLHCQEMLRFTKDGFDKLVVCPTCEQPIRLPDEDEAMTDEDIQEENMEETIGRYEDRLRASGYMFPQEQATEEPPAEVSPDGEHEEHPTEGDG